MRSFRWLQRLGVMLLVGGGALFAYGESADEPAAATQTAHENGLGGFAEYGLLGCDIQQMRAPNDHALVIRGRLINPYDAKVDGVRMVVTAFVEGDDGRALDSFDLDLNVSLDPHGEYRFNREITTNYSKLMKRLQVVAFAKTRGGQEVRGAGAETIAEASRRMPAVMADVFVPVFQAPVPSFSLR